MRRPDLGQELRVVPVVGQKLLVILDRRRQQIPAQRLQSRLVEQSAFADCRVILIDGAMSRFEVALRGFSGLALSLAERPERKGCPCRAGGRQSQDH